MNKKLYYIFTAGLALSLALVFAGYIYALAGGYNIFEEIPPQAYFGQDSFFLGPPLPETFLYLGLFFLNLTPVAGLFYCMVYFLAKKEYRFFAVCTAIMALLAAGAVLGIFLGQ